MSDDRFEALEHRLANAEAAAQMLAALLEDLKRELAALKVEQLQGRPDPGFDPHFDYPERYREGPV